MECLVGSRVHSMMLFAGFLCASLAGNDVRLETARVFTQNFDINFHPGASVCNFRTVLVKEHGTDGAGCCSHLHTGFKLAIFNFFQSVEFCARICFVLCHGCYRRDCENGKSCFKMHHASN